MDKNTVIAVVLAVVVIVGGMLIQSVFFPAPKPAVGGPAAADTSQAAPAPAAAEGPRQGGRRSPAGGRRGRATRSVLSRRGRDGCRDGSRGAGEPPA